MTAFRGALLAVWLILAVYTALVIADHGLGLLPIFFGDIARMGWPGQFNLDFLIMLGLSALWVAWRSRFSATGLILAVLAFFGGAGFLLLYLIVLAWRTGGDATEMLLGARSNPRP